MDKNSLTITISDINKTKSYSISQLMKKIGIFVAIFIILIISISFWSIGFLNDKYNTLKETNSQQILILEKKKKALEEQNLKHSKQIQEKIKSINELSDKLEDIEEIVGIKPTDDESLIQRVTLLKITSSQKTYMLQSIPNGYPLKHTSVTAKFGYRIHPITKKRKFHKGIDLKAKINTRVFATADGVIRFVDKRGKSNFGKTVIIAHNFGFETIYAHLNKPLVKQGDIIKKGQLIALSGNTGRSTGPHLHYEVRWASKLMNPIYFMKWGIENYENIFKQTRGIKWESLINLMNSQSKRMVLQ